MRNKINSRIDRSIDELFKSLLKVCLKSPEHAVFFARMASAQKRASKKRLANERRGLQVPAFMIVSVTQACNLRCKGCYSRVHAPERSGDTGFGRLKSMVGEAYDLGISIVLTAGGEPLIRKEEIVDIALTYPEMLFPVFTNGMLIDDDFIVRLKNIRNIVPIISLEGSRETTDERRGEGVFDRITELFGKLNKANIFYGVSITVTAENLGETTEAAFVGGLVAGGCKAFIYTEYVPVEDGTEELTLTEEQRECLLGALDRLGESVSASFIAFPGDERQYGGCIASGRGFIHVGAGGDVEPCPFAPFSDSNINEKSLEECLRSDFLSKIRENHGLLTEGRGGCALWAKRELVRSFLNKEPERENKA